MARDSETARSCGGRRLALALVAAATLSCSALLDFDGISGAAADAGGPVDGAVDAASDAPPGGGGYRGTILADAPLAYWRFGESEGPRAIDETGRSDGTYFGSPTLGAPGAIAGDPDTAWRSAGPTGGMSAGTGFDFAGSAPFTLEAWIRPDVIDAEFRMIFSRATSDAKGRQNYALYVTDGKVGFERHVDGVRVGTSAPAPAIGGWSHIVVTHDGAKSTLYVDGTAAAVVADARPASPTEATFVVGTSLASDVPFLGTLDEAAVYDVALSAERIRTHFERARSGN